VTAARSNAARTLGNTGVSSEVIADCERASLEQVHAAERMSPVLMRVAMLWTVLVVLLILWLLGLSLHIGGGLIHLLLVVGLVVLVMNLLSGRRTAS
jgi:hypothetical protein